MRGEVERRSYRQFCGLARALDVVGERWTLLIVRNLLLGPRRYTDLLAELPGVTTNLLAKRLRDMEQACLVEKFSHPAPTPATVYRLTPTGAALEPTVMALAGWGGRFMDRARPDDAVNVGWGMLSLKRRYRGGRTCVIEFVVGGRAFELEFTPTYLGVQEKPAVRPTASARMSEETFRSFLFGRSRGKALVRAKAIKVDGSLSLFNDCLAALEGTAS